MRTSSSATTWWPTSCLPPPAYVIEAYLEATLALRDPKELASHETKLAQLKKDYDERKTFLGFVGSAAGLEDDAGRQVRQPRSGSSGRTSKPSCCRRCAQRTGGKAENRLCAVDRDLFPRTAPSSTAWSRRPTSRIRIWKPPPPRAMAALSTVVWFGVRTGASPSSCSASSAWAFGVIRPLVRITAVMQQIAKGDLAIEVPFADRQE